MMMALIQDPLQKISEYWKHGDRTPSLLILGSALLIIILLSLFVHYLYPVLRDRQQRARLFKSLSAANELTPEEQRILDRTARMARLEDPALIFVKRSVFDDYAHQLASPHTIDALRRKLYL